MTDQQNLGDDIAFMRGLAEAGREAPMLGGSILVAAGLVFGTASFTVWALLRAGFYGWMHPIVWGAAGGVFLLCLFALRGTTKSGAGGSAQAMGVAWSGVGWAIFAIVTSLMLFSARLGDWTVMSAMPSIILALYGSAWFVAACLRRAAWLHAVAFGSFAMALVNGWYAADGAVVYLIYGVSLLALLAVPGLVLMRQARAAA